VGGMARPEIDRRVDEMLEMVGLSGFGDRYTFQLSGGQQQRVALARSLAKQPQMLLLDEPLGALDKKLREQMQFEIKRLHEQLGFTVIYVTHDQTEALTFAQKVVVMHEGRVVQMGTPEELFETPAHTFVGYFIGSPGMNLLDADVQGTEARLGSVSVPLGAAYGPTTGRTQIGIRPDYVSISDQGLPVTVKRVEDVGRHRILRAELAGQPLNAILPEGATVPVDPRVSFPAGKINVYANDWRVAPAEKLGGA
jgi:glycerol transport system ATP-binding protein